MSLLGVLYGAVDQGKPIMELLRGMDGVDRVKRMPPFLTNISKAIFHAIIHREHWPGCFRRECPILTASAVPPFASQRVKEYRDVI